MLFSREPTSWFAVVTYGFTAVLYGVTAAGLVVSHGRGGRPLALLVTLLGLSAVWAAWTAVVLFVDKPPIYVLAVLDALHLFAWVGYILLLLLPRLATLWLTRLLALVVIVVLLAGATVGAFFETAIYATLVIAALIGLLAVQQVLSNAREERVQAVSTLCLAAAIVFVTDLFLYSQALLGRDFAPVFWAVRGVANVAVLPLIIFAVQRHSEWGSELFVSRQVVFYTAGLIGVGCYAFGLGLVAYLMRSFEGGGWSFLLESAVLLGGVGALLFALFSARIRTRLKVFLVKHFYRSKYDYRDQWLRLTHSLGRTGDLQLLATNALKALARIIGSERGALWLARERTYYECMASIDDEVIGEDSYPDDHRMVAFLVSNGWVIDSDEYQVAPDRYGASFGNPRDSVLPPGSIIVPLDDQGYLQGFVILGKPQALHTLNFEDHDILKTAGRQVAAVLAQALAKEKLAETRQFEAMNKLSTFLMHDLKNVVAQQELIVANAQRFKHRPEFIEDAIATIRAGADRTKRVLEQLSQIESVEFRQGRVDISKVLLEVRSQCADRQPVPEVRVESCSAWVSMDRDRLINAIVHLVRNAQDATAPDGQILIEAQKVGTNLFLTVADTGTGMERAFIRDRLFRPFDSTKGGKGMGIGAYQVRETVRASGGDVSVQSEPGVGTRFQLRLSLSGAAAVDSLGKDRALV